MTPDPTLEGAILADLALLADCNPVRDRPSVRATLRAIRHLRRQAELCGAAKQAQAYTTLEGAIERCTTWQAQGYSLMARSAHRPPPHRVLAARPSGEARRHVTYYLVHKCRPWWRR